MKRIRLLAVSLLGASLMSGAAFAGTESGFYIGAGVGQASVGDVDTGDPDIGEIDFDGDDTGYKIFAGYNFGVIPLLDLAIEGGYVDFGNPEDDVLGVNVETDVTAIDLFGLIGFNIGPVGIFGKVGAVMWDADASADGIQVGSDDGTDPAYGLGARLKFGSLEVRAEYEFFDVDISDVDMISASVAWTF